MPSKRTDSDHEGLLSRHPGVYAVHEDGLRALLAVLDDPGHRTGGLRIETLGEVSLERSDAALGNVGPMLASGAAFDAAMRPQQEYSLAAQRTALVRLEGVVVKAGWSWPGFMAGTLQVRRALDQAVQAKGVESILLNIDSPGGTVAGTEELADAVRAAAAQKPVHAHIDDLGASAAYWVASGATTITANRTAEVGSIGVLAVIDDASGAFEKAGILTHVVSTGPYKGAFAFGAPVTDQHLKYLQGRVDETMGHFQAAITSGRGLTGKRLDAVSDGRVWGATEAQRLGLIDRVASFDQAVQDAASAGEAVRSRRRAALARAAVARSRLGS